jgi:hypothetical protein
VHELGFIERRENIIFLGPPRRRQHTPGDRRRASFEEAQATGRLQARLKVLTHPALLVGDEIGYLPISRTGAMLFFSS